MLKRLYLFMALVIAGIGLTLPLGILKQMGSEDYDVKFYVEGEVSHIDGGECIRNGADTIVKCSKENAQAVYGGLSGVLGVSISFHGDKLALVEYINKFGLRVRRIERIEGITLVYGYNPHIMVTPQLLEGEEVNIQLALSENALNIGFPLLLTDF